MCIKNVRRHSLWFGTLLLFTASVASADIIYDVTVDTSSISGTSGSLDFNFNPGPLVTEEASLQILDFSSNGTLEDCASNVQGYCNTGDVTGTLPSTLTFDNGVDSGSGFNDYFTGFTYGATLSFVVDLSGPAITSPNPAMYTSGSTFAFSMFSDAAGMTPALTNDLVDGFAATIDVDPDGSTTVNNFSSETTVSPVTVPSSAVPEPSGLPLLAMFILGVVYLRHRRAHAKQNSLLS